MVEGKMATTGQSYIGDSYPLADSSEVQPKGGLYGTYSHKRLEPRGLAVLPVIVRAEGKESVGLLRDISHTGMFFYCSLRLAVGSQLEVMIRPSVADSSVVVCCLCRVVRIEASLPGAATGMGVAIEEYLGDAAQAEGAVAESTVFSS